MKERLESKNHVKVEVKWYGYVALIVAILFFSGIFSSVDGPLKALDFSNLAGTFGKLGSLEEGAGTLASNFRGTGGAGVKDGWLFALTLFPVVMFALGVIKVVEYFDGLKAAQKLLTPLLRPLMGLPGICGLTMIASLQSADAGASMLSELGKNQSVTEKEKIVFASFQFSGGGALTNYLASGGALFAYLTVPIIIPLVVILVLKVFGANLMRIYVNKFAKEEV